MKRNLSFILVLIGVLALLQGCVVVDFTDGKYDFKEFAEKSFKRVANVNLDNFQGNIIIEPATDGKIKVQYAKVLTGETEQRLREIAKKITVDFEQSSSSLTIITDRPEPRPQGINSMYLEFRLYIPSGVRVNVKTSNGSIDASGMRDTMYLRSSNGRVTVNDQKGDLTIRTSNGSIESTNVVGEIDVESSNGRIVLNNVTGQIDAETSNGSIEVFTTQLIESADLRTSNASIKFKAKMRDQGRYDMETSNGSIDIWLDKHEGYDLYAKTSTGRIQFNFSTKLVGTYEKNYVKGEIQGGGANVTLKTSNGGITIHEMEEDQ